MFIPLDIYRRASKAAVKAKVANIVSQCMALESSKKRMRIRVGFALMYPKEEDPIHRSFRAGIKYFLVPPRGSLSPNLKCSNTSPSDSVDCASGGAFAMPNILVPRERPLTRGEQMVQAALPPATPRKPKKKTQCSTPVNIDMTESSNDSKFQETLLDEGCGTQVDTLPHPYMFSAYSPGQHIGPSGSIISPY
jgi:hypothetical protein